MFLVSTSTMVARITRAKKRAALAGFALTSSHDYPGRAVDVARVRSSGTGGTHTPFSIVLGQISHWRRDDTLSPIRAAAPRAKEVRGGTRGTGRPSKLFYGSALGKAVS